jgi:large subunit ribosomal protein L10
MSARPEKIEQVELLKQELADVPHAILVNFSGLDVAGATDLRRRLREEQAQFRVVKNTLALRAIAELPLGEVQEAFEGQTAIAYTSENVVSLAKVLSEFTKEHETPTFKAGVVDGLPIDAEQFEQIAKLPSREELIAKALYLMQYPVSGLVTALSSILRSFVVVLEQVRLQKEEGGE